MSLPETIHLGPHKLHLRIGVLDRGGERISLSDIERRLLGYLADHRGQPVAREVLLHEVLGYRKGVRSRALDSALQRLRKKLEVDPSAPMYLKTVPGRGISLDWEGPTRALVPTLPPLVGREGDRRDLVQALGEHRLVSVVGPVGVGKSHLVLDCLGDLALPALIPPMKEVRSLDALELEIKNSLGASPSTPVSLALRQAGEQLLVLDPIGGLDVGPTLVGWVASCPLLRLVVVGRQRWSTLRVVEVAPLSVVAASSLYRTRIEGLGLPWSPQWEQPVQDINQALGHLPLGIVFAAARSNVLPPPLLLSRLSQPEVLAADQPPGASRYRSLWEALQAATGQLSATAQKGLALLTTLAGPFALTEAEAALHEHGISNGLDVLQELMDWGLLRRDQAGLDVLAPLRLRAD